MAKARALDKRRRSVRNIRKITRTMELVATAQFRRAMERAISADAFVKRLKTLVADLATAGLNVSHPLLEASPQTAKSKNVLLVLTANRGMCGGYNSGVLRQAAARMKELSELSPLSIEVSGKRGITAFKFKGIAVAKTFTQFDDKPTYEQVLELAMTYLDDYMTGRIDRLDVAYTKFMSLGKQHAVVETLLPISGLSAVSNDTVHSTDTGNKTDSQLKREALVKAMAERVAKGGVSAALQVHHSGAQFEFLPSAQSILDEVVPNSFKLGLFKCFLDAAVSEQIARMTAMKAATENASKMISLLTMTYNRARQSQITSEITEIVGGADALS